jgi:hypothetical protein
MSQSKGSLTCGGLCAHCLDAKAPPKQPQTRTVMDMRLIGSITDDLGPLPKRRMGVFR